MTNFMSLLTILSKSKQLFDRNKLFYNELSRFYAYIFSPTIRKKFLYVDFSEERINFIRQIIEKIDSFIAHAKNIMDDKESYSDYVKQNLGTFLQKEQFELAIRFIYNSIQNSNKILELLMKMKEEFQILHKADSYQQIREIFHSVKGIFEEIFQLIKDDEVLLSDIQGRLQIRNILQNTYEEIKRYILNESRLETGDILLSFKSKEFLSKSLLSGGISKFTKSQVSHSMVCVKISKDDIRMVDSRTAPYFFRLEKLKIMPGEILIVTRPRISNEQRALLLRSIRNVLAKKTKFSKIKLIGIAPTILLTKLFNFFNFGYKHIPNPAKDSTNLFCNEFVNEVFKDAGILLTPKSRYSSTIFAADILRSPFVDFVGLLANEAEKSEEAILKYLVPSQI